MGFRRLARRSGLAAPAALLATALAAPGSSLAASSGVAPLEVTPSKALGSKSITVKWRTDRAPKPGRSYRVAVRISGQGGACTNSAVAAVVKSWTKGRTVTTVLRPSRVAGAKAWWCSGTGSARVIAGSGAVATVLARAYFEMSSDPRSPTPTDPIGTPVKVNLLKAAR